MVEGEDGPRTTSGCVHSSGRAEPLVHRLPQNGVLRPRPIHSRSTGREGRHRATRVVDVTRLVSSRTWS
jgi:hypothetical protein